MTTIWVVQEGYGPDDALKISLDAGADVCDLLRKAAPMFSFGDIGKILPSQLQVFHNGKQLPTRSIVSDLVTSDDTCELRPKPGELEHIKTQINREASPNSGRNSSTKRHTKPANKSLTRTFSTPRKEGRTETIRMFSKPHDPPRPRLAVAPSNRIPSRTPNRIPTYVRRSDLLRPSSDSLKLSESYSCPQKFGDSSIRSKSTLTARIGADGYHRFADSCTYIPPKKAADDADIPYSFEFVKPRRESVDLDEKARKRKQEEDKRIKEAARKKREQERKRRQKEEEEESERRRKVEDDLRRMADFENTRRTLESRRKVTQARRRKSEDQAAGSPSQSPTAHRRPTRPQLISSSPTSPQSQKAQPLSIEPPRDAASEGSSSTPEDSPQVVPITPSSPAESDSAKQAFEAEQERIRRANWEAERKGALEDAIQQIVSDEQLSRGVLMRKELESRYDNEHYGTQEKETLLAAEERRLEIMSLQVANRKKEQELQELRRRNEAESKRQQQEEDRIRFLQQQSRELEEKAKALEVLALKEAAAASEAENRRLQKQWELEKQSELIEQMEIEEQIKEFERLQLLAEEKKKREEEETTTTYYGDENVMVVMRHSIREDREGFDKVPLSKWPDKHARPYDPPISDFNLPAQAGKRLKKFKIKTIISSPYRRCLQTAGIVARAIGVDIVHIDDRLGEWYREVARCCRGAGIRPQPLQRLSPEVAQKELGEGVCLGEWIQHEVGESDEGGLLGRVASTIPEIATRFRRTNVLLVSHGDIANRYLPEAEYIEEYSYLKLHEAGYVALKAPHGARAAEGAIIEQFRTESM